MMDAVPKRIEAPDVPAVQAGGVQVIHRAALIFRALDGEPRGLTLSQLATRLELPRSTVQRIVMAIVAEGLLASASRHGGVRLGPDFLRLAASSRRELWREVEPFMRRIFDATTETVDCAVLDGTVVRILDLIPAHHQLRAVTEVGSTFPVHGSAKGKALLAQLDPEAVTRLLPARLERLTGRTTTSRAALLRELQQVRRTGIAYDLEEVTPGICAAAIALQEPMGNLVAISVAAPTQRFQAGREAITEVLRRVRAEAMAAFSRS
jgi:IclR family transcriptional regulator, acetate operon repressor